MALPQLGSRVFSALKNISIPIVKTPVLSETVSKNRQSICSIRSVHLNSQHHGWSWLPKSRTSPRVRSSTIHQHRQFNQRRYNSQTQQQKVPEEPPTGGANNPKHMRYLMIGTGVFLTIGGTHLICEYGAPKYDDEGNLVPDEFSAYSLFPQYLLRFYKEAIQFKKTIEEPSRAKLLPNTLPSPYIQPPYTLCLEVTGVLVHPEWSYQAGWRFKKRPGVDFLLQQVAPPLFEVVIYTKENGHTAYPIIDGLDPQGYVMYRLFKDSTRYQDGDHMKDLGALNRPIKRVIHIDCDKGSVRLNPSNALVLKKWEGEMSDKTLIDLAMFLRTIAESGVDDVRGVLEYYSQFDDPLAAFRENQRKLAEQEVIAQEAEKAKPTPAWRAFKARQL